MSTKKSTKAAVLNTRLKALVASAAAVGMNVATGYSEAVKLFRSIGTKSKEAMKQASDNYVAGYAVRYLSDQPVFAKRWGNMGDAERLAAVTAMMAKASPDSSKPDRRTELEHKALRAAAVSLATAKRRAGLVAEKKGGRKPRPASKASTTAKAPPVDLVKASPKLADKKGANDYFATAAAALLATVNKNSKLLDPRLSTAVTDFHGALVTLGLIAKKA